MGKSVSDYPSVTGGLKTSIKSFFFLFTVSLLQGMTSVEIFKPTQTPEYMYASFVSIHVLVVKVII